MLLLANNFHLLSDQNNTMEHVNNERKLLSYDDGFVAKWKSQNNNQNMLHNKKNMLHSYIHELSTLVHQKNLTEQDAVRSFSATIEKLMSHEDGLINGPKYALSKECSRLKELWLFGKDYEPWKPFHHRKITVNGKTYKNVEFVCYNHDVRFSIFATRTEFIYFQRDDPQTGWVEINRRNRSYIK